MSWVNLKERNISTGIKINMSGNCMAFQFTFCKENNYDKGYWEEGGIEEARQKQ